MLNVVIFGAPGSGKGTQSDLIIEKYGLFHISTGEILRGEIEKQTELGKIADSYISKGRLVPDEIIIEVLSKVVDQHIGHVSGFIFDGFPRTISQGESLDRILKERNADLVAILSLSVEEQELINRLLKRGLVSGRSDDNLETIQARLKVYREQTEPLKEYYKKQGKYIRIQGSGSVEEIFGRITESIDRINK